MMKNHARSSDFRKLLDVCRRGKRFLVTAHVNPDPDALSSQLAIGAFLRSLGKRVVLVNEEPVPERFLFLPGVRSIKPYSPGMKDGYDVVIVMDCGSLDRIGRVRELLRDRHLLVNIDHHITNHAFGDVNLVRTSACSTAEIVYDVLRRARFALSKKVATLLYIGIMTDTGSFRYESTTPYTHHVVSRLMKHGFSPTALYKKLYESIPLNDMEYFNKVVHTFESLYQGKVICLELRNRVLKKFSKEFDLRDKIFRYLRAIKGVEVLVILTEINRKETRINLRSLGNFNVALIANHFNGGGHRRASGCLIARPMAEARRKVLKEIKKVL